MIKDYRDISKSQIQVRMRRLAAGKLGVTHIEQLDPIICLFLDSLSEEIYKIAGEIENSEERVLDKLASILVPSIETMAYPSHCILHASPQIGIIELSTHTQFGYFDRKTNQEISFYPTSDTKIYNGTIPYFIHNGNLFRVERDSTKTLQARSKYGNFDKQFFWFALDLGDEIQDLFGISFYFDLPAIYNKTAYLNLLTYTTWTIANEALVMDKGLPQGYETVENVTLNLLSKYGLLNRINMSVSNLYKNHYLTIASEYLISERKEYLPFELQPSFSQSVLSKIEKPLIWIKVECPHGFTPEIIESLQISINAFPVLNKMLVSMITEVRKAIPIVPLNTASNQSFLAVHHITDSTGNQYYDASINEDCGIYTLRKGGIEGYSKRDAKEYLTNMIENLSNEVSSFFKDKGDKKMDVKRIEAAVNDLINDLKKQQENKNGYYEKKNYLLLAPEKDNEVFFIDYWVTNGEETNKIRAGETFVPFSELPLNLLSVYSLSATHGGTYASHGEKKRNLYKKSLTHHKLLVTDEDICSFCLKEFETSIGKAEIRKGFVKCVNAKMGFVETIDVYLTPLNDMKHYINKKDKDNFLQILKKKSPSTYNYRVFINQNTEA